jgi:tetratricopeptide (TPR) repeat protein
MVRLGEGDLLGAEDDMSRYIAKVDGFPAAYQARAAVRLRLGRFVDAFKDYDAAVTGERDFEGVLGRAWARRRLGRNEQALEDLRAAFPLAAHDTERARALVLHRELAGDDELGAEGLAVAEAWLAARPDDLYLLSHRATLRELAGDAEGALADRRRVIERAGLNPETLSLCIDAREALGETAEALADAERWIAFDAAGTSGIRARGSLRFGEGDLAGASADYAKVVAQSPTDTWAWTMQGVIAAAGGDREAGRRSLEKAVALDASAPYPTIWCAAFGGPVRSLEPHAGGATWAARVASFWRGGLSAEELIAESGRTSSAWRARERACEAHAYVGIDAERRGNAAAAREHYRKCVETGVVTFVEYAFAKARLASGQL